MPPAPHHLIIPPASLEVNARGSSVGMEFRPSFTADHDTHTLQVHGIGPIKVRSRFRSCPSQAKETGRDWINSASNPRSHTSNLTRFVSKSPTCRSPSKCCNMDATPNTRHAHAAERPRVTCVLSAYQRLGKFSGRLPGSRCSAGTCKDRGNGARQWIRHWMEPGWSDSEFDCMLRRIALDPTLGIVIQHERIAFTSSHKDAPVLLDLPTHTCTAWCR